MRSLLLLLTMLAAPLQLRAQAGSSAGDLFPAQGEFSQLQQIQSEKSFSDPARLKEIENGILISDVGFRDYEERVYALRDSGTLTVEIMELIDYRAAFSLLSLLRSSRIEEKGLGDAYAEAPGEMLFCQGRVFVRVTGPAVAAELMRTVAESVSGRIGPPERKLPSLLSYLPEKSRLAASLKYFPAIRAYETFTGVSLGDSVAQRFEMEIVSAGYAESDFSGVLRLMKFPTEEMAEEYFEYLSSPPSVVAGTRTYFSRSGPLLSVLEGSFSSRRAGNILSLIQYGYSVQWIKDDKPQTTIVWGIPVQILNATVLSFFFVLLLCLLCIVLGSILAGLRILLRVRFPGNPLDDPKRTEIIRLKLK